MVKNMCTQGYYNIIIEGFEEVPFNSNESYCTFGHISTNIEFYEPIVNEPICYLVALLNIIMVVFYIQGTSRQ
jgi:hypothetical protein